MTASSRRLSVGNRSVCGLFRCCCVAVVLLLLLSLSLVAVSIGTVEASVDPSVRSVASVSFGRKKSSEQSGPGTTILIEPCSFVIANFSNYQS